jgi:hypothetical protein
VDEAGTEAAAVTGVTIQPTSVVIRKTNPPLVRRAPAVVGRADDRRACVARLLMPRTKPTRAVPRARPPRCAAAGV